MWTKNFPEWLGLVLVCVLAAGCNRATSDGYNKAIESGTHDIPTIKEFCQLFPNSQHLITYYTGENGPPTWTSKIGLWGRYTLDVQMEIDFDSTRTRIIGSRKPHFILGEIDKITEDPARHNITTTPGTVYLEFGPEQWKKVVENQGNLEVLGVKIEKNRPVDGFEKWWQSPDGG